jgi:restriction endonuclease S subunit
MGGDGRMCPRCHQQFASPASLRAHLAKKRPCRPTIAPEAAAAAVNVAGSGPLGADVMEARNILRSVGVTDRTSIDCINAVVLLRELEQAFPAIADPAQFGPINPIVDQVLQKTVAERRYLFSALAARPFDEDRPTGFVTYVKGAFHALARCRPTAQAVAPIAGQIDQLIPLEDTAKTSRAMFDLIRLVRDRLAIDLARDTFGSMYMSVIREMMGGKELGQFFTPAPVVDCACRAAADGRALGAVLDPTCGTGGFLCAAARRGATSLAGVEISPQVHLIASVACLLATRRPCEGVVCGDFLGCPVEPADTILANPPFGMKPVALAAVRRPLGADGPAVYPLASSTTGLMLQRIVHRLRVGGRAAVVLPLGHELGGQNVRDVRLRRALAAACAIRKIVMIPPGTFETTSVGTAILVLDKVRELVDCSTQPEAGAPPPATEAVAFERMRTNPDGSTLADTEPLPGCPRVDAAALAAHGWSLVPAEYAAAAPPMVPVGACPTGRLGDICQITAGNYNSSDMKPAGRYPFFNASAKNPVGFGDEPSFNYPDYVVFVKDGNAQAADGGMGRAWHLTGPSCATTCALAMYSFRDGVLPAFVATYLNASRASVRARMHVTSTGLGHLTMGVLTQLEIPLPPLDVQQHITQLCAEHDAHVAGLERARESLDALAAGNPLRSMFEEQPGVPTRSLGEICQMTAGNYNGRDKLPAGRVPFYNASAGNPVGFGDEATFDFPEYVLMSKDGGSATDPTADVGRGHAWYVRGPTCATSHVLALHTIAPDVSPAYLGAFLNATRDRTRRLTRFASTGIASLGIGAIKGLTIPVPPLERQRELLAQADAKTAEHGCFAAASAQLATCVDTAKRTMLAEIGAMLQPVA